MGKLIDLSGRRFGELTVLSKSPEKLDGRPAWLCVCDCGKTRVARGEDLRGGQAKSCGQHRTKAFLEAIKHGSRNRSQYTPETNTRSRLYTLWRAMKWRCEDESHEAWPRYGGAGISVCPEWQDFARFRDWALESGYQPYLTIDRKDGLKGYEPDNCRWATPKQQARNRLRGLATVEAWGEVKSIVDWAEDDRCLVSEAKLRKRLANGQPPEFAMTASEHDARHRASVLREAAARRA